MDTETYDQITLNDDMLGDAGPWLTEGMRLHVEMLDGQPIGIQLPKVVEAVVAETEAVVKGQTAARSNKPATLENGVTVQVPPFINVGDKLRVDPGERRYVERAK
jgi:elongation factor P